MAGLSQPAASTSAGMRRTGLVLTALPALFMVFDGVIHLMRIKPVEDAFAQLGLPMGLSVPLGILELVCLALYLLPQTAVLGAILLTGYLGGAAAINLRAGNPLASTVLFSIYVGILLWAGLYLRDARIRALIPARQLA